LRKGNPRSIKDSEHSLLDLNSESEASVKKNIGSTAKQTLKMNDPKNYGNIEKISELSSINEEDLNQTTTNF